MYVIIQCMLECSFCTWVDLGIAVFRESGHSTLLLYNSKLIYNEHRLDRRWVIGIWILDQPKYGEPREINFLLLSPPFRICSQALFSDNLMKCKNSENTIINTRIIWILANAFLPLHVLGEGILLVLFTCLRNGFLLDDACRKFICLHVFWVIWSLLDNS